MLHITAKFLLSLYTVVNVCFFFTDLKNLGTETRCGCMRDVHLNL